MELEQEVVSVLMSVTRYTCGAKRAPAASANLFSDLGLTSLELVDLAVELERRLGIDEFPVQLWLDVQPALGANGYTVGSLVGACRRLAHGLELV